MRCECDRRADVLVRHAINVMYWQSKELGEAGFFEREIRRALDDLDRERRPVREKPSRQSVVYFAEREGFVKIGTTTDLRSRMKALAAGGQMPDGMTVGPLNLLATVPGTRDNEQFFHRKFARLRVDPKREWFLFEAELREFISGLKGSILAGAA